MATTDIDHDKFQKQLAILMQNSTAFSSMMYKLLVTSEPMDVEVNVFTDENTFETITVPNRAKGSIPALYGEGLPEEVQTASYGALYIDLNSSNVYIKVTPTGTTGWLLLATEQNIKDHNNNSTAHEGYLAQVHGDSKNYFEVADLVANDKFNGKYAVNKDSLDAIVGDLKDAQVNDNSTIVAALNEVIELNNYDSACIASGGVRTMDGAAACIILDNGILKVVAPFIAVSTKGRKYEFTTQVTLNMNSKDYAKYNIYLDLDKKALVLLTGTYEVSASRPYFMALDDCWLNISSAPYKFLKMEYAAASNSLNLSEKNYVFIGTIDWRG